MAKNDEIKIPKTINFEYEGKQYKLEFSRETAGRLEKEGFIADDAIKYPLTYLPQLFHGAFYMHHPEIGRRKAEEILATFDNKAELIAYLGAMYNHPIKTLIIDDGAEGKNTKWEAGW